MPEPPSQDRHANSSPQDLIFEANLKEFANRVGLIVGLEIGGKIDGGEAYHRIKKIWKELRSSKKSLLNPPADKPDEPDGGGESPGPSHPS